MSDDTSKTVIVGVVTAVATAAVMAIIGFFGGVFERGTAALTEDQIKAVLEQTLVTDSGRTYGAALSEISTTQATLVSAVEELKDEVDDVERAMLELSQ